MSKTVNIGGILIGGGNKVAVQSMTTFPPEQTEKTVEQLLRLQGAGCDIARFSVAGAEDAKAIKTIKEKVKMPLVADIHFDYKLAIAALENGVDKVRINPGNLGGERAVKAVADCLKRHGKPVRVGANGGSLEKDFSDKYGLTEKALGESALRQASLLEKYGVSDIVISVKASSVPLTVKAYEYVASRCDYPLHIGVTEAGVGDSALIKSSVGIGSLLLRGIGDTVRVSLSADPVEEVYAAKRILRAVGLDKNYSEVIACPTCGRCEWDCMAFAKEVEERVKDVTRPIKIAVMGCVVNGPGEAADADVGIAGGKTGMVIFKKGEKPRRIDKEDIREEFFKEIDNCLK